jgi:hypothetical protein
MARNRITVYLSAAAEKKLNATSKAQNRSVSSLVSAAIDRQILQTGDVLAEGATRQLARVEARLDKVIRDNAALREIMLLFVRVWLEYTPPLDESEEDEAAALAEARFERFLDLVRDALVSNGARGSGLNGQSVEAAL